LNYSTDLGLVCIFRISIVSAFIVRLYINLYSPTSGSKEKYINTAKSNKKQKKKTAYTLARLNV